MNRRHFLACAGATMLAGVAGWAREPDGPVQTVTGPVAASRLGFTLMHEHVLVDFIGADSITPDRYRRDDVAAVVLPHLQRIVSLGCRTLVDCTPAFLGRDPQLLARLAKRAGLNIVTNTGLYGAGSPAGRYVPSAAQKMTAAQLAASWIAEYRKGIGGIKPGIIKTAVSGAPLSELDRKLIRAAAITHRETGLTIASHTGGGGAAAIEQLDMLKAQGVPASAFVWVHAHNERDPAFHARAAERGAWVEFDSLRPNSVDRMLSLVEQMANRKLLGHVLVSGDAGWYHVGEPGGGAFAPYDLAFTHFLPELKKRLGEEAARQVFVENAASALLGRTR